MRRLSNLRLQSNDSVKLRLLVLFLAGIALGHVPARAAEPDSTAFGPATTIADSMTHFNDWFNDHVRQQPAEAMEWELLLQGLLRREGLADSVVALAHTNLGKLYFYNSDTETALKHYRAYETICEARNDSLGLISAYGNQSLALRKLGELEAAAELMYKGIELSEKLDLKDKAALLYFNMGHLHLRSENPDAARKAYENADRLAHEGGAEELYPHILLALGTLDFEISDDSSAYQRLSEVVRIAEENDDIYLLSTALTNLSIVCRQIMPLDSVIPLQRRVLDIDRSMGNPASIANSELNLGSTLAEAGHFDEALPYLERGIVYFEDRPLDDELAGVYEHMAYAYAHGNRYKEAFDYAILWKEAGDTLTSYGLKARVSELEAQYESERQAREILSLQADKDKEREQFLTIAFALTGGLIVLISLILILLFYFRKRHADQNRAAVELEHRLLRTRMNPHFLFNSLNSLQRFYIDKDFEKGNEYLADFSQMLRWILDHSSRETVSLEEEIDTVRNYVSMEQIRLGDRFQCTIEVDPELETEFIRVPPLLLQPFVENAIWHGILPGNRPGELTVSVRALSDTLLRVCIRDNGIGYEQSRQRKQTDSHTSHGIAITRERLGGQGSLTIRELRSAQGVTGTEVDLRLTINQD